MSARIAGPSFYGALAVLLAIPGWCLAQKTNTVETREEFGPNVRAYLQYLKDEEEVVDDRISRREIRRDYYLRNMNRIRALRLVALKIARSSGNDYLPELEAVALDEMRTIFEHPPPLASLRTGEVFNNTYRFLGKVKTGQQFYVFARLDPYEQAELIEQERRAKAAQGVAVSGEGEPAPEPTPARSP